MKNEKEFLNEAWYEMGFATKGKMDYDEFTDEKVPDVYTRVCDIEEKDRVVDVLKPFLARKAFSNPELMKRTLVKSWWENWVRGLRDYIDRAIYEQFKKDEPVTISTPFGNIRSTARTNGYASNGLIYQTPTYPLDAAQVEPVRVSPNEDLRAQLIGMGWQPEPIEPIAAGHAHGIEVNQDIVDSFRAALMAAVEIPQEMLQQPERLANNIDRDGENIELTEEIPYPSDIDEARNSTAASMEESYRKYYSVTPDSAKDNEMKEQRNNMLKTWSDFCTKLYLLDYTDVFEGKFEGQKLLKRIKTEVRKLKVKIDEKDFQVSVLEKYNDKRSEMVEFIRNLGETEIVGTKQIPYILGMASLAPDKKYNPDGGEYDRDGDEKKWRSCQMLCKFSTLRSQSRNSCYADDIWPNITDRNSLVLYMTNGKTDFAGMYGEKYDNMLSRVVLRAYKKPEFNAECTSCKKSLAHKTKVAGKKGFITNQSSRLNFTECFEEEESYYVKLKDTEGNDTLLGIENGNTYDSNNSSYEYAYGTINNNLNSLQNFANVIDRYTIHTFDSKDLEYYSNLYDVAKRADNHCIKITVNGMEYSIYESSAIITNHIGIVYPNYKSLYVWIPDMINGTYDFVKFQLVHNRFEVSCPQCGDTIYASNKIFFNDIREKNEDGEIISKFEAYTVADICRLNIKNISDKPEYIVMLDRFYPHSFFAEPIIEFVRQICKENGIQLAWYSHYNATQKRGNINIYPDREENDDNLQIYSLEATETIKRFNPTENLLGATIPGGRDDYCEDDEEDDDDDEDDSSYSSVTLVPYYDNSSSRTFVTRGDGTLPKKQKHYYYITNENGFILDEHAIINIMPPDEIDYEMREGVNW